MPRRWLPAAFAATLLASSGAAAAETTSTDLPGRLLFIHDGNLWVWENSAARELATGGTWRQPRWAPDSGSFAYVYQGTNFSEIYVTDPQGQSQTRLTRSQSSVLDDNDWNFLPSWSPDGGSIAFVSDRDSYNPTLWLMNADGSGAHAVPTPGLSQEAVDGLSWSPDGSELAITLYFGAGPSEIAIVPMTGGRGQPPARVITDQPRGALDPAWSPDGDWIAYAARVDTAVELFAARPDGSAVQQLTSDGLADRAPTWSPDGQHLAYLSSRSGWFEAWVLDVQRDPNGGLVVTNPRALTHDARIDAASGLSWGS